VARRKVSASPIDPVPDLLPVAGDAYLAPDALRVLRDGGEAPADESDELKVS